jgi:carboxypeptidase family protein/TonB-dependent receptor-like protein
MTTTKRVLLAWAVFLGGFFPLAAQTNTGELRLHVTDPSGLAVKSATVELRSEGNQYANTLATDETGSVVAKRLSFGVYEIRVDQPGFAAFAETVRIRSALPLEVNAKLSVASVNSQLTVSANETLIDPNQPASVNQIGSATIENRLSSLPGRSLQDLVNSQPGWLYEGNAVLHPRGSEYQTQFVVDGLPLQDNRSPSFGPEAVGADAVDSIAIYTAGIPAEYGRKMGGVIEVNTARDTTAGFHGQTGISGGSFDTIDGFFEGQYVSGKNTFGGSASGGGTAHYLNPVVPENFTNRGTVGDFGLRYERDFTPSDRLTMSVRHELARYELPNEHVQQAAGQLQTADNFETMGTISYQHIFSLRAVGDIHAMVRDNANDFYSNDHSTPIEVEQHNRFREGYVRGTFTLNRGRSEWKVGFESDNTFLHEHMAYNITDPDDCEPGSGDDTACAFEFLGQRPDLEQSAFIQDLYHAGNWTINAGIRWDHYQLILNRQAVDPRFAISRYFPSVGLLLHFSYDRVFQTPWSENILLSSSAQVDSIDPDDFLRLPVEPSEGNYYEAGLTKGFGGKLRVDANYFRRLVSNYADDDQIDNTTISFPIAFQKSIIYGAEGKIELTEWKHFSGFLSYSYEVGNAWNPVTGGLFFGDDADSAEAQTAGHFPDSQDQRNTARGRLRYQIAPRLWVAGGIQYDTGLPFEFQCDPSLTIDECVNGPGGVKDTYGQAVVNRINFDRGRIDPAFQVNASVGADVYKSERFKLHFQADGQNLTNVLDVVDFGGLFSGNAIGPSRSYTLRLRANF